MASMTKEKELKSRLKDLMRFRKNGVTRLKEGADYEAQRLRRIRRKNEMRRKQQQQQQDGGAGATLAPVAPAAESVGSPLSIKSEDMSNGGSPLTMGFLSGLGVGAMSPATAHALKEFNVAHLSGSDLLSSNEKKLCASLRLTPAHYITYKTW